MYIEDLNPNMELVMAVLIDYAKGDSLISLCGNATKFQYSVSNEMNQRIKFYDILKDSDLEVILKEYDLESFKSDLIYLVIFVEIAVMHHINHGKKIERHAARKKELLDIIKYFYLHKDINVEIRNIHDNDSALIKNPQYVKTIKETLIQVLYDFYPDYSLKKQYTKEYFEENALTIIDELFLWIPSKPGKGRKTKHKFTGDYIWSIHKYLENNTTLKADPGVLISRKQASFIYRFLNEFNLFSDELNWREDNVRHIFKDYMVKYNRIMGIDE